MRPSPFNKNSGKPAAAKAAPARPPSKLGQAAAPAPAAAKPAARGKGKTRVVDSEVRWVEGRPAWAAKFVCHPPSAASFALSRRRLPASAFPPPNRSNDKPSHPLPCPQYLQDEEEDEVVDMTVSPAPARAVAPRRTAAAAKPKYAESDSEGAASSESDSGDDSDDYCPSDD